MNADLKRVDSGSGDSKFEDVLDLEELDGSSTHYPDTSMDQSPIKDKVDVFCVVCCCFCFCFSFQFGFLCYGWGDIRKW